MFVGSATTVLSFGVIFAIGAHRQSLVPWLAVPAIVLGGGATLWCWFGRSGRSTVALEPRRLVFHEPAHRGAFRDMLTMADLGPSRPDRPVPADRAEWEAELDKQRRRQRHAVAKSPEVPVEDLGSERGVSVGSVVWTVRIGQDLGDADREWLVEVLKRWRDSEA
jgi:hypothetical protein